MCIICRVTFVLLLVRVSLINLHCLLYGFGFCLGMLDVGSFC